MTQGASDGTVPRQDLRSVSQISHGSMALRVEDCGELSNEATRDVRLMPGDTRFAAYGSVAAPLYVSDAGNMLRQHGVYMSADVNAVQQQHAFSLLHQRLDPGFNCSGDGLAEKDLGFMERAAGGSVTALPDRSASASMCDSVGGKGIGYVGGGFTEMIRGITRLPTAADVQSLMQARAVQGIAGGSSCCPRTSPTRSKEMQSPKADYFPLPPMSHCLIGKPTILSEADQVCESDTELTTLSLLPNVPSKMGSPGKGAIQDHPHSVQPVLCSGTHNPAPSLHQQTFSRLRPSAKVLNRDRPPFAQPSGHGVTHSSELHGHQQGSSMLEPAAKTGIRDGDSSVQLPTQGVTHVVYPQLHHQAFSRLDPSVSFSSRNPCMPQLGAQLASGVSFLTSPSKNPTGGMIIHSANLPSTRLSSMGIGASPVMSDEAIIDQVSLEQVYGGSTDPVLLVDDNNHVLWFNKPYDKALKSASERSFGSTKPTGPYIDPLGHPTPLGSFVLPVYGNPCRVTLWGFLKKLVTQDSELPLQQQGLPCPSSQLQLGVGEASLRTPLLHTNPNSRSGSVVCATNSRLTTVTLESVTEIHMNGPASMDYVEAVEVRLSGASTPAFITDCSNRVRWVNVALKQMLGLVNYESSSTRTGPVGHSGADGAMSIPLEASTFVVCCTERMPHSAWAFSCRVNLEWMKGNKRRSMTVPCDVSRLPCIPRSSEVNWVWQFDMAVSLCLS